MWKILESINSTVAKYLTPSGRDIHKNGIVPDIVTSVQLKNNQKLNSYDLGSEIDNQYKSAEKALINNFRKYNIRSFYMPKSSNYKYAIK